MQDLTQSLQAIKACLFDFDGVIIDSETVHNEIKCDILDKFGITYSAELVSAYQGRSCADFYHHVVTKLGDENTASPSLESVTLLTHHKRRFLEKREQLKLIEGVERMIAWPKMHSVQALIVSSSSAEDICYIIDKYFDAKTFDGMVTYEDTKQHKPSPEPYQAAIDKCGYTAKQCLVIEDSPSGVLAAKLAGCIVVGITNTFPAHVLVSAGADMIVASYDELIRILQQAQ